MKHAVEAFVAEQKLGRRLDRLPVIINRMERPRTSGNLEAHKTLVETVHKAIAAGQMTPGQMDQFVIDALADAKASTGKKWLASVPNITTFDQWDAFAQGASFHARTFFLEALLSDDVSGSTLPSFANFTNSLLDPRMVHVPNAYMASVVVSIPHPVDTHGKPLDLVALLENPKMSKVQRKEVMTQIVRNMMAVAANDERSKLDLKKHEFARNPQVDAHTSYTHFIPGSRFEGLLPYVHHMDAILRHRAISPVTGKPIKDAVRRHLPAERLPREWYVKQFGSGADASQEGRN